MIDNDIYRDVNSPLITRRHPISDARLNGTYCLVRLTYLQAKFLFLAARWMQSEINEDFTEVGWTGAEGKALREALAKLKTTSGRWPS